jgi:2,4-dienoyl-CoA reductase-like NADH-dependent reductase (Old Yellow Enzyme family)/thioredoxin reductase
MNSGDKRTTDPLLQPFQLKHLTLKNRVMSTSHACDLGDDGMAAERYQRYHEEKAKGGIALSMFGGSSNVAPDSPDTFGQLNVGVDACIPHLQKFSERMHRHGAALMCQLTHLGRRGSAYADNWLPIIAPSPSREILHRSFAREMDEHDIARVITAFGDAAMRCKEGGLDGIETLASGHLIGQFLSPVTNQRGDRFGGSLANRSRFGLMVHEEIRRRVGENFIVGLRYTVDEGMADGLNFGDCVEIAQAFEAGGTIDFFNANYGRMDTVRGLSLECMPGMASPLAPWLAAAAAFKREVSLPVFHAARITDMATARHAIAEGLLDMVAMTRAHIADPHIVRKLEAGMEDHIRPCVGMTNCDDVNRPTCIHNAATGRETIVSHTIERSAGPPRRVVVVGGGPAGLDAARVAGERGHDVTLFEAAPQLGGQLRLAATASWRKDIIAIADWRALELERLGVEVRMNVLAEPEDVLALDPDVVIVATGGVPDLDWLDGREHVIDPWETLTANVTSDGTVIVYDGTGRHTAASAAERLAMAGRPVNYMAIDDALTPELAYSERFSWKNRFYELAIPCHYDQRLVRVARTGNRLVATFENLVTTEITEQEADHIVVEHGTRPVDSVFHGLAGAARNGGVTDIDALLAGTPQPADHNPDGEYELYRIGDCVTSRNIAAAVYDALRLCRTL